jgi:4-aminobutyrate aminotransferase-like enzyme
MNTENQPPTVEELLALKKEFLFPCLYHFYQDPPILVKGEGCWLIDSAGKRYLDCYSGVTVMSAGHGHPEITEAIHRQVRQLQHTTTIYLTEGMFRLAQRIANIAPGKLKRAFFCASGSEANETALLLATLATGRKGIVALTNSLHGRTKWAMSVTGIDMWRTDPNPLDEVHFVPHAYCQRCPLEKSYSSCGLACAESLESTIQTVGENEIAALIAEPIQGNGGVIVPPEGYWQRIREICDAHGILLIFDEIQTGMNRTGRWFACEHWGVSPDIMTMAKALGNGAPIAATVTNDDLAAAYTRPGAATFGANPVSCAAALATLKVHEKLGLGACAEKQGQLLRHGLRRTAQEKDTLSHVRGKGLMVGMEVVDAQGDADPGQCDGYLEALKDAGILAGKTGAHRNTLTFMPPLTISPEEVARIVDIVARVCN